MLRAVDAGLLALCLLVAGLASLAKGQDANWDLQNYHFYDPWALVHGRLLDVDVVAAQLQTFHNPTLDLLFYAMAAHDWPPRLIAFVLAMPAGVAGFLLGKIVLLLFPGPDSASRSTLRIAAFAIGISGAVGWAVLGTTMNEWPIAALALAAIFLVTRTIVARRGGPLPAPPLLAAGCAAGIAAGLKLTAATFVVAMCIALVLRRPLFRSLLCGLREAAWLAAGAALGAAVSIGWWLAALWVHFANPVFPYLNEWFRSPWWDAWPVLARSFGPFTLEDWLSLPYDMFRPKSFFVMEIDYRDARVATLYTLALVAGLVALVAFVSSRAARRRARILTAAAAPWYFLGVFWLAAFVLWTAQYSIYRYILTLELLSGILIVGLVRLLVRSRALPVVVAILALAIVGTTRWPDWGHVAFGERWFDVKAPALPRGALVVLASDGPFGYLLPYLGAGAQYVGAYNNLVRPGERTMLAKRAEQTIREHVGPLYSLSHDDAMAASVYAELRLAPVDATCTVVRTNMPGPSVRLCELSRVGPP
ncbi:MAG TPA: hypothetical protein VMN56_14210 [Casimicrobiaceae bacterium]|nr:hypothetical protein [Casimicrobiaceae bacterium]